MLAEHEQFYQRIKEAKRIALIVNCNRFGDSLGSALALAEYLSALDKEVQVIAEATDQGQIFNFLPGFETIKSDLDCQLEFTVSVDASNASIKKVKYQFFDNKLDFIVALDSGWLTTDDLNLEQSGYPYDLIITLGCPDLDSLGEPATKHPNFFYRTPIINIDCDCANDAYGQLNIIDVKASSVAEIIFNLLKLNPEQIISPTTALNLYAGIVSRTKNFKSTSVSPSTLSTASELIKLGADKNLVIEELYRKHTIKLLKLWGFILAKLTAATDKRFVWSEISADNFAAAEGSIDNLSVLVDELIVSIPDTLLVAIFITSEDKHRAILWSIKNLDVLDLSVGLNSTGSKKIAEFTFSPEELSNEQVIQILEEKLKKILDK